VKTGSRILLELLREHGVDVIFGYPGGAVIHLYDELTRFPEIRHILVRHEQAAAHAADGYARATGRPGVCLATSGPGATNLVTGLACAYCDSVPLIAITGQVATHQLGRDSFQEVDIVGITRSCTKHNHLVRSLAELPDIVQEAFMVATTGRPGPVLIDIPRDVLASQDRNTSRRSSPSHKRSSRRPGHPLQVRRAAEAIARAQRPILCSGAGVINSGAHALLRRLAEGMQLPVVTTFLGLGSFPSDHPLSLGMLGMHGTYGANMAVTNADLLIVVGCRLDDRATGNPEGFAPKAKIVHVDIDPSSIGKTVRAHIPIVGDASEVLKQVLECLGELGAEVPPTRYEWLQRVWKWKASGPDEPEPKEVIKPQQVIKELSQLTSAKAIISTDVGQHQMWTALNYSFRRPRTLLSSGGLGAMGYGLPAAIGAQVAFPLREVVCISGDGSFQMNMQELGTLISYDLPVKVVVLNNGSLGMVRQWQSLLFEGRYSETIFERGPDLQKLAQAYGIKSFRALFPDEVVPCLTKGLGEKGPVIMEFLVDPEEKVYPMVLPGGKLDEMIMGKEGQSPSSTKARVSGRS